MSLSTSLKGRLRNTNLPKTNVLFPLFEAVVNSIHSIDERIKIDKQFVISDASIKVRIVRSAQMSLDDSKSDITGFEIVDNGIGFNSKNYESFQTLDTGIGSNFHLNMHQISIDKKSCQNKSKIKVFMECGNNG